MAYSHDRTLLAGLGFNDPDKKNVEHDLACRYLSELEQREKLIEMVCEPLDLKRVTNRFQRVLPCPICRAAAESACRQWQPKIKKKEEMLGQWERDRIAAKERGWETWAFEPIDFKAWQGSSYPEDDSSAWFRTQDDDGRSWGSHEDRLPTPNQIQTKLFSEGRCEVAISKGEGQYKTTIGFLDVAIRSNRTFSCENSTFDVDLPAVNVEVKIASVSWGDVLRQIALYRAHFGVSGGGYMRGIPQHETRQASEWIVALRFNAAQVYLDALKNEGIHVIYLGDKFTAWMAQQKELATEKPREI